MALEYICSHEIFPGKPIYLPRGIVKLSEPVIKYQIWEKSPNGRTVRKFNLFYASGRDNNGSLTRGRLDFWTLPERAAFVVFGEYGSNGEVIIVPTFYDMEGNTLKTGNR
jgi:hypothetical protein